ncbi:hypothetical protein Q5P01_001016 [Channa striata]|uniref:Uncharacterized protein n=1 Tax=Channa striata TaxID=64152 RepID=A0AA88IDT7_CHASR|nr:hypothetical protein Q5P01_001016 [Channa striata]
MQPFSFGSGPPPFRSPAVPGFYSHPKTKVLASRERREGPGFAKRRQSRGPRSAVLLGSAGLGSRRRTLCSARRWGASSLRRRASLLDNGVSEMGDRIERRRAAIAPGNRTCWLDRSMLSDSRSDYREPICDRRGLCDPLELAATPWRVRRQAGREVSSECPLACGSPCRPALLQARIELVRAQGRRRPRSRGAEILVASERGSYRGLLRVGRKARVSPRCEKGRASPRAAGSRVSVVRSQTDELRSSGCADRIGREASSVCVRQANAGVVRGAAATASLVFSAITTPC